MTPWGSSRSAPGHYAGGFSRRWRALTEEVPGACATATSSEVSCLGFGDKPGFNNPWIGGMMNIFCLNSADVCLYFCFLPALNEVLRVAGNWKRRVLAQWQRFYPVGSALDVCGAYGVFFTYHKVSCSISGICGPLWYTIHKTTTASFCFICNNQSQAGYLWIAFFSASLVLLFIAARIWVFPWSTVDWNLLFPVQALMSFLAEDWRWRGWLGLSDSLSGCIYFLDIFCLIL